MNAWHREEEPHNNHETPGRQTKQSNQLSHPYRDDCKTRMDTKPSLNARANASSGVRGLNIGMGPPLHPYHVYASNTGYGESAHLQYSSDHSLFDNAISTKSSRAG